MNKLDIITRVDLPAGAAIYCDRELQRVILRGSVRGEIIKEGDKFVLQARRVATGSVDEIGPTGTYPDGKLDANDEGGLNVGVAIDTELGVVVLAFGSVVADISMGSAAATELADALIGKANELDKLKGKGANGI